jgi:UDP-N-acetylmuramate--alanine ligase
MKLRIGVLMGGTSIEREVSFNSGRTICDHLDTGLYEIIPLFQSLDKTIYILPWRFIHRGKISDFEHRLAGEAQSVNWEEIKNQVDFIYLALHGRHSEDGEIQAMLELLQIPYLGSKVFASAIGMNKPAQKLMLQAHGIRVPKGITVKHQLICQLPTTLDVIKDQIIQSHLSYPLICKPENEGSSLGVHLIKDESMLAQALINSSFINNNIPQAVLIEEYMTGMEFSCIILSDSTTHMPIPLPASEIIRETGSDVFNYEQKYMPGRAHKITPARISNELMTKIQDTCIRVMKALSMQNLARIDGFITDDHDVVIIDPNTLSGMGPSQFIFRQAAELNISHTMLINHLIKTELSLYGINHIENMMKNRGEQSILPKTRVGVIFGGRSNEKEISLESGRNVCYKLSPEKYEVLPLFLSHDLSLFEIDHKLLVRNSTKEIQAGLNQSKKITWSNLKNHIDFAFIALHGGEGENGIIQGSLETLDIPYNGSGIFSSALCMNKFNTNMLLKEAGFEVPQNTFIEKNDFIENSENCLHKIEQLGFPVIIKPHDDGCSVFVQKVHNKNDARNALNEIFSQKDAVLAEEFIRGMELTVGVLGNDKPLVLPPSYTVTSGDILSIEEKFLPGAGENQTPAPLSQEETIFVQSIIGKVFEAAQCSGYARIDCFYQNEKTSPTSQKRLIIIEINSLPGLTPATCIFHQAAELGMKPMDFIDKIVELGFEKHRKRTIPQSRPHID